MAPVPALAQSDETAQAQRVLTRLGFEPGPVDGLWGGRTETAVAAFLTGAGLDWDGQLDADDLAALRRALVMQGGSLRPVAGVEIENAAPIPGMPPDEPTVIASGYWWLFAPVMQDFDGDGRTDFLYAGTHHPTNIRITGEDTGGLCGGGRCDGPLSHPALFLYAGDGSWRHQPDAFVDTRARPGQSSTRQILTADYNGDGVPDVYISDTGVGTHEGFRDSYFLSQPDGRWIESARTHLSHPDHDLFGHGAATGDIDGDGDMDIVIAAIVNERRFDCLMNDGTGVMTLRAACGPALNALAIELGDMDRDGDLDIVYGRVDDPARHDRVLSVALNDGLGRFRHGFELPAISGHYNETPELSIWDLDRDGDLDVVVGRVGRLYVGTAVQVIENLGDGRFASDLYDIAPAPDGFVTTHEANSWNTFIEAIRFQDADEDGDTDILLLGATPDTPQGRQVFGAMLRNDGDMDFTHIRQGWRGNPVRAIPDNRLRRIGQSLDDVVIVCRGGFVSNGRCVVNN